MRAIFDRFIELSLRLHWKTGITALVIGFTVGIVISGYKGPSFAWQLALGVLLGGIVAWVIPKVIDEVSRYWSASKPLHELLTPLHINAAPTAVCLAALYPRGIEGFEKSVPLELRKTIAVEPHHGVPWVLTEGDAVALGYVMGVLSKAGRTENTMIARDDAGLDMSDANLICIGSPKSNIKARQINDAFKAVPLRFRQEDGQQVIAADDDGEVWRADDTYDFGILVKASSDYNSDRSVMLIAGISYIGTVGVAHYLWHNWRDLSKVVHDHPYGAVIRVRRDNYQYAERIWTKHSQGEAR